MLPKLDGQKFIKKLCEVTVRAGRRNPKESSPPGPSVRPPGAAESREDSIARWPTAGGGVLNDAHEASRGEGRGFATRTKCDIREDPAIRGGSPSPD